MVTISKVDSSRNRFLRFFDSIQIKFLFSYVLLITGILIFLNTYPVLVSRNLVFDAKETFMKNQSSTIASSVESLDSMTADNVGQLIGLLDTDDLDRIIVINAEGERLFDEVRFMPEEDDYMVLWGVDRVLACNDVFYSVFSDRAFSSISFTPVMSGDSVIGAVFIYEYDADQGQIISGLSTNLLQISIAVFVGSILISGFFSRVLTRRLTLILDAIKSVRAGEYSYRIELPGQDEFSQLGEEFNSLTGRLQKTEEIRRQFVADASHELKTPLASIRLLSDSILQNDTMDKDTVREFVADIGNESERLARITEKLLNLTKHDNKVLPEYAPVDMQKILRETLRVLEPLAAEQSIELRVQPGDPCFVFATDDDIYQVMLNLSENAIKYNKPNGFVQIALLRQADQILFTVEDTGIGIPEKDLPHIFDRFYRVDKARSREAGGSGLGLSIVQTIVQELGGIVTAENRPEGGMRFVVTLPVYTAPADTGLSEKSNTQVQED